MSGVVAGMIKPPVNPFPIHTMTLLPKERNSPEFVSFLKEED
jgi:hypothetical protein